MKIDEITASWDRVKVSLRAGLRFSRLQLVSRPPPPEIPWKSMQSHENQMKSMKIDEIATSWNANKC